MVFLTIISAMIVTMYFLGNIRMTLIKNGPQNVFCEARD